MHIHRLTVCEPIAKAMASGLEARRQLLQGRAADQHDPVQSVSLGLLVLQLSRMLDIAGDAMTRFCTQEGGLGRLNLRYMASEKDGRSRAAVDAASAEHSMETGLELREPPSVWFLTQAQ